MSPSEYQELVEFLTGQFAKIDQRFHDLTLGMDQRFKLFDSRLDAFQTSVGERFREVFGHFDAIHFRLERLDQRYQGITQQLRRIEAILEGRGRPPRDLVERRLNG
jgi:hypothetical protein